MFEAPTPAASPVFRQQTFGVFVGVSLVVAALTVSLVATIVTTQQTNNLREERDEEIAPLERRLDALQIDLVGLVVHARVYGLSGEANPRDLYAQSLAELEADTSLFVALAETRELRGQADDVVGAIDAALETPATVVDARDRGDVNTALAMLASDDQTDVEAVTREANEFEQEIAGDINQVTADIADAEDRALLVTLLALAVGIVAAAFVVWLAVRNRALALRVAADRRRLDDLIASVQGVVWEAWGRPDAATQRIDFVSAYVEEMLGYRVEDWLATPNFWLSVVHPDDKERAAAEAAAIFASGRRGESQFRWVTKDGRVVDVLASSAVIRGEAGAPAGMRGITFDVTARVQAERQLRFTAQAGAVLLSSLDAAKTLRAVAQLAVPDVADWCAIHLADERGDLSEIAVAHRDPGKVAQVTELQQRYPPRRRDVRGVYAVFKSGQPEIVPFVSDAQLLQDARDEDHADLLKRLGLRSYIGVPMIARGRTLGVISLITADSGRTYGADDLELARDLAARAAIAIDNAALHRAAERERARFESIVDSAALAVCRIDAEGRVEHVNPAAEGLLGYATGDLAGLEMHAVVHPHHTDTDDSADCPMFRLGVGGRRRVTVIAQFTRRNGSQIDVEATSAPIIVGDGSATGAVIVLQDVTARLLADQMKDDFIGFASHELRSPLTTINGMAKWLLKDAERNRERFTEDEMEAIEALSSGSDRMGGIIELFLDLTRIESDRLVLEPQEVDLVNLLRTEAAALTERSPGADVSVSVPAGSLMAWVDGHRIRQVLVNLLDNAVKYGGTPPVIYVGMEAGPNTVTFRVRDNGDGIATQDAARVFDRFYRGRDVSGKGLGIGLFVSREITERLGGTLTFERIEDRTEFKLTVPVERDSRSPEQPRKRRSTAPA